MTLEEIPDRLSDLLKQQLKAQEYDLTDFYLQKLSDEEDVEALVIHLRCQLEGYHLTPTSPGLKAINVIRALIEDKGLNPDELLAKEDQRSS